MNYHQNDDLRIKEINDITSGRAKRKVSATENAANTVALRAQSHP